MYRNKSKIILDIIQVAPPLMQEFSVIFKFVNSINYHASIRGDTQDKQLFLNTYKTTGKTTWSDSVVEITS